tara:strand:- start:88 stop:375 length:288 start_codon:yes stop_codon:yes gene_type:complete
MTAIGSLKTTANTSVVVWKDGKHQIRALLKKAGIKPSGTFRMRRENSREYVLGIEGGGTVRAARRPGANVTIHRIKTISVDNLSAAQLAAILAQG